MYFKFKFLKETQFIPILAPLQLIAFAENFIEIKDTEEKQIADHLLRMLELEPNFGWHEYERFHAEWEALYRLLCCGEVISLQEIYRKKLMKNPSFIAKNKVVKQLDHQFSNISKSIPNPLSTVLIPADGNAGFDILNFEQCENKEIAIAVECRFSQPGTQTWLSVKDVEKKYEQTKTTFKSKSKIYFQVCDLTFFFADKNIPNINQDDVYLVVCAYRKLEREFENVKFPNVIVLGIPDLQTIYTPTLASQPQFILTHDGN